MRFSELQRPHVVARSMCSCSCITWRLHTALPGFLDLNNTKPFHKAHLPSLRARQPNVPLWWRPPFSLQALRPGATQARLPSTCPSRLRAHPARLGRPSTRTRRPSASMARLFLRLASALPSPRTSLHARLQHVLPPATQLLLRVAASPRGGGRMCRTRSRYAV